MRTNKEQLRTAVACTAAIAIFVSSGCASFGGKTKKSTASSPAEPSCVSVVDTLNQPTSSPCFAPSEAALGSFAPRTVADVPTEFWELTLDEAVQLAMQQSDVIRDLGGRVLTTPEAATTVYEPAIEYTDPNFGVEAALSAFDANLTSQFNYGLNDRVFNNVLLGGGVQELQQNLVTQQNQLSKVAATGTAMNLRSTTVHDRNNRVSNLFGHLWETQLEAEIRQPLLQGAGIEFNRVAGPNGTPGMRFSNGVVIAQINNDISKVDFEIAVRRFVRDIESAYWQLFEAYYDFGAKQAMRDAAERTWKTVQAKYDRGMAGGEADKEAQARAQFYFYQDATFEALNGSNSAPGVYQSERLLRNLMGLSVNDGRLLRPIDKVSDAPLLYDWDSLSGLALTRRAEIRRQKWKVKQEELRLKAARNFILPRLDALALYRVRGFGDDLAGNGPGRFSSAYQDFESLDHQEWEFGLQLDVPLGRRQAYAGLRHAELRLARERSVLREQELQVSHALGNVNARSAQTYASMVASRERLIATEQRVAATEVAFEADKVSLDLLLDAQERFGAAQSRYYQVVASYANAEASVRLNSGGLLASHGIKLQGDCPMTFRAKTPRSLDYRLSIPNDTSRPYDQLTSSGEVTRLPDDSQIANDVDDQLHR